MDAVLLDELVPIIALTLSIEDALSFSSMRLSTGLLPYSPPYAHGRHHASV